MYGKSHGVNISGLKAHASSLVALQWTGDRDRPNAVCKGACGRCFVRCLHDPLGHDMSRLGLPGAADEAHQVHVNAPCHLGVQFTLFKQFIPGATWFTVLAFVFKPSAAIGEILGNAILGIDNVRYATGCSQGVRFRGIGHVA